MICLHCCDCEEMKIVSFRSTDLAEVHQFLTCGILTSTFLKYSCVGQFGSYMIQTDVTGKSWSLPGILESVMAGWNIDVAVGLENPWINLLDWVCYSPCHPSQSTQWAIEIFIRLSVWSIHESIYRTRHIMILGIHPRVLDGLSKYSFHWQFIFKEAVGFWYPRMHNS